MTQVQAYQDDSYRFEAETTVLAAGVTEGVPWIAATDNIVHPQGGGQPADRAWVDGVPAHPAKDVDRGLVVLTALEPTIPLPAFALGASMRVSVDRTERLQNAALHTGGHLIEALVQRWAWRTAGNNHFPGQARVEFSAETAPNDLVLSSAELRNLISEAITADLPVTATATGDLRTVSIADLHTVPCGGTHVRSLGELRDFVLPDLRMKKGRIKASYTVDYADRD